jgi:hypothetical protein
MNCRTWAKSSRLRRSYRQNVVYVAGGVPVPCRRDGRGSACAQNLVVAVDTVLVAGSRVMSEAWIPAMKEVPMIWWRVKQGESWKWVW